MSELAYFKDDIDIRVAQMYFYIFKLDIDTSLFLRHDAYEHS